MPVVSPERLAELQHNAQDIRNICILAHVDHGKTSLTDALIATNGIISPRQVAKIRYLDSRPDEQLRGITMESSAISLCFSMAPRRKPAAATASTESSPAPSRSESPAVGESSEASDAAPRQPRDYLINLIDSPGHVDFSSEVSTASRLCDGALVLVDAVEGVQSQTIAVLRQAWQEKLRPLLVINKIDRLIWELKMSAAEAYTHLVRLVEEVNAVLGAFFQGERMEEDLAWRERLDAARAEAAAARDKDGRPRRNSKNSATDEAAGDVEATPAEADGGQFEERDDEDLYFAPERNNIIFASALDGWAFTVTQFAAIYEKKLGLRREVLEKVLWGDFYLDPKTKRVLGPKHLKGRALRPMFVQLVLEPIWSVYDATTGGAKEKGDPALLDKILSSLSITLPPHVRRSKDARNLLTGVFGQWLPVSTAVLVSVVSYLPSPPTAQAERMATLIAASPGGEHVDPALTAAMTEFRTDDKAPCVAYVSKMVSIPAKELPEKKKRAGATMSADEAREAARRKRAEIARARAAAEAAEAADGGLQTQMNGLSVEDGKEKEEEEEEEPEHLVGFARLYSGELKVGDTMFVLPPKYTPANPEGPPAPQEVTVTALYLLMGRALESLSSVPAGCVFGIGGLAGHVLKNGTLSSVRAGAPNLAGVSLGGEPIVRVALEPADPRDLGKMVAGLKLLEQADPCARYEVLESGEHVIRTAGELHLERCLKDLRERFARCDIQQGAPIVPYREGIVKAPDMAAPKNKDLPRGTVAAVSSSKQVTVRLRVQPLPEPLTECVEKHAATIRRLVAERKAADIEARGGKGAANGAEVDHEQADSDIEHEVEPATHEPDTLSRAALRKVLLDSLAEVEDKPAMWRGLIDSIASFGPRRSGPNILFDTTKSGVCVKFWEETTSKSAESMGAASGNKLSSTDFTDRIAYAFQLATAQGPLCLEPMQGVAVFFEDLQVTDASHHGEGAESGTMDVGRVTSEVIRTAREAIHSGFLDWSPRLLLAMYGCEIQAPAEVLGKVYAVVTRRRGKIVSEAIHEGTPFFTVVALLPVVESFGFSAEMLTRTSGGATPQLRFAGFVALDQDPFWVPSTEDELEDLGELADKENVAKRYVDAVRRRKGLLVKELRRVEGEKARTLKK